MPFLGFLRKHIQFIKITIVERDTINNINGTITDFLDDLHIFLNALCKESRFQL